MNTQEIGLQARVAQLRMRQYDELGELMTELQDALQSLEHADLWPDLPVEYRKLACQLKVLTGIATSTLDDQFFPEPEAE